MSARILDKKQDSARVIKLVEDLRQAILIYQVGPSAKNHQSGPVDAFGTVIATTVYQRPGRAVGCKFLLNVFAVEADGWLVEQRHLSMHF